MKKNLISVFCRQLYGFRATIALLAPSYVGYLQNPSKPIKSAFCKGKMHATIIDKTVCENATIQSPNELTSNKTAHMLDKKITEIAVLGKKLGKTAKICGKDLKHFNVSRKTTQAEDFALHLMLQCSDKPVIFRKPNLPRNCRCKFVTPQNNVMFKNKNQTAQMKYKKPRFYKPFLVKKNHRLGQKKIYNTSEEND